MMTYYVAVMLLITCRAQAKNGISAEQAGRKPSRGGHHTTPTDLHLKLLLRLLLQDGFHCSVKHLKITADTNQKQHSTKVTLSPE